MELSDEAKRFERVIHITQEISQIKDIDLLLERILTEARTFVSADAGSIYLREENRLKFSYTQNETFQRKLQPGKKLIYSTFSIPINNSSLSGFVATTGEMLNIHDVYSLPIEAPYSFDKHYDGLTGYRTKSVLTIPLKNYRSQVIGVLQLINAKDDRDNIIPFIKRDELMIAHFANSAATAIERAQMTRAIIMRMISMAALRDPKETGAHVNRVAAYSVELYETWARNRDISAHVIMQNKDTLRMAAMLHDVGKIAIADAILKKPARLTPEEIAVMQQHTWLGSKLFTDLYSEFDEASSIVALNHHEKWDGTGYPGHVNPTSGQPMPGYERPDGCATGKKGAEIPPFGRVVAIADVYDALSSRRSYKEAWDESKVLETIKGDSGTHFDPEMIDAFFECLDVLRSISQRYPE